MTRATTRSGSNVGVFILARNEQKNIRRCLEALRESTWDVTVLDSGSTDSTPDIVRESGFADKFFNAMVRKMQAERGQPYCIDYPD